MEIEDHLVWTIAQQIYKLNTNAQTNTPNNLGQISLWNLAPTNLTPKINECIKPNKYPYQPNKLNEGRNQQLPTNCQQSANRDHQFKESNHTKEQYKSWGDQSVSSWNKSAPPINKQL